MVSHGSLVAVSYNSDRPTTRPRRPGFLDQIKSHIGTATAISTFIATIVTGGWTLYNHMATDPELMDHNVSDHAHPTLMRDFEERVSALENGFKKTESGYVPVREDLAYVAERLLRLMAADGEPDRRKKKDAGDEAVQTYRAQLREGATVQKAMYEALHRSR